MTEELLINNNTHHLVTWIPIATYHLSLQEIRHQCKWEEGEGHLTIPPPSTQGTNHLVVEGEGHLPIPLPSIQRIEEEHLPILPPSIQPTIHLEGEGHLPIPPPSIQLTVQQVSAVQVLLLWIAGPLLVHTLAA